MEQALGYGVLVFGFTLTLLQGLQEFGSVHRKMKEHINLTCFVISCVLTGYTALMKYMIHSRQGQLEILKASVTSLTEMDFV